MLTNKTQISKGYMSTSFKPSNDYVMRNRVLFLDLEVPKGYKGALYVQPLAYESFKYQDELLFDKGTKYNIYEIEEINGIYYAKGRLLQDD